MVGRLIEKQDIRVTEKRSCKKYLDLQCAWQLLHQLLMVLCSYSKSIQKGLGVSLCIPAVHICKLCFKLRCTDSVLIREIRLCIYGILFLAHIIQVLITLNDSVENYLVIILELILLEEGKSLSGCNSDLARRRLEPA